MKNIKKPVLTLACMMLMANSVYAAEIPAVSSDNIPQQKIEQKVEEQEMAPLAVRNVLSTSGVITAIDGDKVTVKGEGEFSEVAVIITDDTYIVDGRKGKIKKMKNLKVGKEVTVYYSSKMTRSMPPQTEAFAVVLGQKDEKIGKFFQVAKVMLNEEDKSVRVLNSNHDVIATIGEDICKDYMTIKEGDSLLLWYDIMTMSLPGQTNAQKAVILPASK